MISTGNATVDTVGTMNFVGNIVPHLWFNHIKFESGKVDAIGALILAEIVYWYRPKMVRCEVTGQLLSIKKRFSADLLQRDYASFSEQFGITKRQAQDTIKRLEDLGVIRRVFRTIKVANKLLNNVLFIELNAQKLHKITYETGENKENSSDFEIVTKQPSEPVKSTPITLERDTSHVSTCDPLTLERDTYTENTTKTTTEINNICSNPDSPEKYFNGFWSAGMKKVGKEKAFKSFIKAHKESKMPIAEFTQMLVDDIQKRKKSGQFGFDATHPTTYLNGKRWEDEYTENSPQSKMRFNSDGLPRTFDHIDYSQGVRINEDGSDGF